MDSILINNNEKSEKEIDIEDTEQDNPPNAGSVSPPESGGQPASGGHVSSFLKFSIQNILQQAAASNTAAAITAAANRRSSDLIHPDMAAVMNDFDMKRAMGALPFW